jgi:peptidyl-prolyl cis-trans isomerase A (cyclophilin A)
VWRAWFRKSRGTNSFTGMMGMTTSRTLRFVAAAALAGLASACGGDPCAGPAPPVVFPADHPLRNPDAAEMREVPPDSFDVRFETTQGAVTVRIYREWAPMGAFRFYNLVRHGFYDDSRFYRVLPGFVAQFGMSGHPEVDQVWHERQIPDDPRRASNLTGTLTYAKTGADSRTTQLFFNFGQNVVLDDDGFAPIGRVIDGMGALFLLHGGYGDTPPRGQGPDFGCMLSHGNAYLDRKYSSLDHIRSVTILP